MSIDEEVIERYSKRWGVSREEAERRLKQVFNNNNSAKKVPTLENLFPEPIGELSKRVQDINQALLSSAYTRRLLNSPPEDIAELRARIENLDRIVGEMKSTLEDQIKRITETLEDKRRKEAREELLKELDEKMNPLRENLQRLSEKLEIIEKGGTLRVEGARGTVAPLEPEKILEEAEKVAEKARSWLRRQGYRIEPERLTKEDVQKMIEQAQREALEKMPPEQLKQRLEAMGYKIVGGPITWEQFEKALEEAKKKAKEEALDDKRIDAVVDIVRESVSKIIEMFKPAVEALFTAPEAERKSSSSSEA